MGISRLASALFATRPFFVSFASRLEWGACLLSLPHLPSPLLPLVLPLLPPFSSSPSGPSSSFSSPSATSRNRARLCVFPLFLALSWGGYCSPGLLFRLPPVWFLVSLSVPASSGMIGGPGCTGVRSRRHYRACRSPFSRGASGLGWCTMAGMSCCLGRVGCGGMCRRLLSGWLASSASGFWDPWWAVFLFGSLRELRSLRPVGTTHCFLFPSVVVLRMLFGITPLFPLFFFTMFCPLSALPLSLPPIVFISSSHSCPASVMTLFFAYEMTDRTFNHPPPHTCVTTHTPQLLQRSLHALLVSPVYVVLFFFVFITVLPACFFYPPPIL